MKKLTNILVGIVVLGVAYLAASCESREQLSYGGTNPLNSPTITVSNIEYNSLTFKWTPVTNAIEYGYTLTDVDGNVVDGGTTRVDSVKIEDLDLCTEYTFHLYAYAAVESDDTTSPEITATASTVFWPIVDTEGTYESCLVTGTTSWSTSIKEVRAEGKDKEYGTFTISSWYNHSGYDLQFTVNSDSTINVLNGTRDGRQVTVKAGDNNIKTNIYIRNGVIINEDSCKFDRGNQTLDLYVISTRTTGTNKEGYDTFSW